MDERVVTRADFDELASIVRDFIDLFVDHVHDMHDADGGGETRSPDRYTMQDLQPISRRLDALIAPALQSGEAK